MKTILIVGIGAGNPEYITVQAVNALSRARVVVLMGRATPRPSSMPCAGTSCNAMCLAMQKRQPALEAAGDVSCIASGTQKYQNQKISELKFKPGWGFNHWLDAPICHYRTGKWQSRWNHYLYEH
jgi:siroheme synthase